MSHKHGTYLGGIRTIEDMRQRCRVDSDTGCWHWGLGFSCGSPKIHFVTPDTKRERGMRGRRVALYLKRGRDLPKKHVAFPGDGCRSADCVNPSHCTSGNRFALGEYLRRMGLTKTPAKIASAKRAARTYLAKITMDDARAIRASEETTYALAKQYGIAQSAISSIKLGRLWQDTLPQASVFSLGSAK